MNDPTKRLIMLTNVLRDVSQGVSSGLHEPDAQVLRRETRLHDVASRLHTSVQDARGEDETERRRAQERLVAATLPRLDKRAAALRRAVDLGSVDLGGADLGGLGRSGRWVRRGERIILLEA